MDIRVRPLEERDLPEADRIFRLAFGTFMGLADPMTAFDDTDAVYRRFRVAPDAALAAEVEGRLVGSNFVTNWGSVGLFGPLTVEPRLWDHGVAKRLLESTMDLFAKFGCRHMGLFTFAHSPKHIALYQKFGFWPRFLTSIMFKEAAAPTAEVPFVRYSDLDAHQRDEALAGCGELTGCILDGLDVSREIQAVNRQRLGDTILLMDGSQLSAFAVCHVGPKTGAGSDTCYVKFGAVRPAASSAQNFERLLAVCEAFAAACKVARLTAGINLARHEAYRALIARGFRADLQGVAMHKDNDPAYHHPGVYVLDDWR